MILQGGVVEKRQVNFRSGMHACRGASGGDGWAVLAGHVRDAVVVWGVRLLLAWLLVQAGCQILGGAQQEEPLKAQAADRERLRGVPAISDGDLRRRAALPGRGQGASTPVLPVAQLVWHESPVGPGISASRCAAFPSVERLPVHPASSRRCEVVVRDRSDCIDIGGYARRGDPWRSARKCSVFDQGVVENIAKTSTIWRFWVVWSHLGGRR